MEKSGMKTDVKGSGETGRSTKPGGFDFNRLYGDLSRKLLSTPVEEIFSDVISGSKTKKTSPVGNSTSPSTIHPAFALYGSPTNSPLSYFDKHLEQSSSLLHPLSMFTSQHNPLLMTTKDVNYINNKPENDSTTIEDKEIPEGVDSFNMENVDIQNLVDEFKVTLERYGVSQRFAARFIMQDTSQGNLSFLMEKGRNKKWAELSARGRLPYIKMKEWLQNKEHQMMTLEMVKYSQEARKNTPRESFNRRERFSMLQLNVLCRMFEENPNPPMHVRTSVAERLGIPLDRVNVWFQNQRARGFPARKNLQFQTMYESGQDSAKLVDMDAEYTKFRDSLSSQLETSPLMTHAEDIISSQKFHQTEPCVTAKRTPSPQVHSPTSTLFTENLLKDDAPLDLSSASSSINTKCSSNSAAKRSPLSSGKCSSNISAKSSSNNTKHNDNFFNCHGESGYTSAQTNTSNIIKTEKVSPKALADDTPKVGAAKRKRGYIPQQIISRKGPATTMSVDIPSPKRSKIEMDVSNEMEYNYLLHTDDISDEKTTATNEPLNVNLVKEETYIHSSVKSESSSTSFNNEKKYEINSQVKTELNNKCSNQSTKSTAKNSQDFETEVKYENRPEQNTSNDVLKVLCASFAMKKETPIDVKEPELD